MEEDRNYRKYNGMSAWELAFGGVVEVDVDDAENAMEAEEEEEPVEQKRGWFRFGPSKAPPTEDVAVNTHVSSTTGNKRIKRKQPLNIPQQKLEGIKHAFTAEALRAIGSDEMPRLSQLLNAGMESNMEVAGKTLVQWAKEMDARDCLSMFEDMRGLNEEDEEEEEEVDQVVAEDNANDADVQDENESQMHNEQPTSASAPVLQEERVVESSSAIQSEERPVFIQDERLAGLSLSDIRTLVQENINLIPALSTCLNDLTAETSISSTILQDVQSTGGRGGLSSASLVNLVRSLKDRRLQAEEASHAWQRAWEEREDELDFFWEEVLDDRMREELDPILNQIVMIPMPLGVPPEFNGANDAANGDNVEYWRKRFVVVDQHISTLRRSIADLAQQSANNSAEIQKHGMGGALSLTKSIRDEIKEFESQLEVAKSGEETCRKKIEIIQERLTPHDAVVPDGMPGQEYYPEETQEVYPDQTGMEDYQLNAIVRQQEAELVRGSSSPPVVEETMPTSPEASSEQQQVPIYEEDVPIRPDYEEVEATGDEMKVESKELLANEAKNVSSHGSSQGSEDNNEDSVGESSYDIVDAKEVQVGSVEEEVDESIGESVDETNDIIDDDDELEADEEVVLKEEMSEHDATELESRERKPSSIDESPSKPDVKAMNGETVGARSEMPATDPAVKSNARPAADTSQSSKPSVVAATTTSKVKPSHAIAEGMSTAIVVHNPNAHASSLSSQIWEILRRIVGFGRVVRTESSYHDAENNPHIMIV